ncbi:antitoxin [Bacteroides nordii]|uniref:antitoxin n=1 Tax=Bacteroides nordii TaxID=291645 RepID=UPI003522549B
MSIWSSIARRAGRIITYPVTHAGTAVQAVGKTTKTAVVGGGLGYMAWESVVNDKPVVRTASDILVGKETTEKVSDVVTGTVDGVGKVVTGAGNLVEDAGNMLSDTNNSTSGVGKFFQGLFTGNGLGMIGDFFQNIGKGKISGLSLAGLIGAAILSFGRFGWLGKIAGAFLGMMIIGNNWNMNKVMGGEGQQAGENIDKSRSTNEQTKPQVNQQPRMQEETPALVIHRGR